MSGGIFSFGKLLIIVEIACITVLNNNLLYNKSLIQGELLIMKVGAIAAFSLYFIDVGINYS